MMNNPGDKSADFPTYLNQLGWRSARRAAISVYSFFIIVCVIGYFNNPSQYTYDKLADVFVFVTLIAVLSSITWGLVQIKRHDTRRPGLYDLTTVNVGDSLMTQELHSRKAPPRAQRKSRGRRVSKRE